RSLPSCTRRERARAEGGRRVSFHFHQLHFEFEAGVRRDVRRMSARAVAEIGRDDEAAFAADLHADDALIPAFDHLTGSDLEIERFTFVARAVELATVHERARVVNRDAVAVLGLATGPDLIVDDLELFRSWRERRSFRRNEIVLVWLRDHFATGRSAAR